MQNLMKHRIPALALAIGLAACSGAKSTKLADDFKNDLQLASSSVDLAAPRVDPALLNSLETTPKTTPQPSVTVRKGPGPRAIRSKTPTVHATLSTDLAAADDDTKQVNVVDETPVPEPTREPVAVAPRPSPTPVVVSGGDGGDYGTSGNGGGIFGPGGGIGGVIIRGGGVDGDHCEPIGGRRGGPVYIPMPTIPTRGGGIFVGGGIGSRGGRSSTGTVSRGGVGRRR